MDRYLERKGLPPCVVAALDNLGIRHESIGIEARERFTVQSTGGTGMRGVCAVVNLSTGACETHLGDWGGANPFGNANPVDLDSTERALPPGFIVIKGHTGHRPWGYLQCHPATLAPLLPPPGPALTADQLTALSVVCGLNSRGRAEYWKRHGWGADRVNAALDSLADLGLVKRSRNGATKITTAGRNVPGLERSPY